MLALGERGHQPAVTVWDLATGTVLRELAGGHRFGIACVAFAAGGRCVVTMGFNHDRMLRVRSPASSVLATPPRDVTGSRRPVSGAPNSWKFSDDWVGDAPEISPCDRVRPSRWGTRILCPRRASSRSHGHSSDGPPPRESSGVSDTGLLRASPRCGERAGGFPGTVTIGTDGETKTRRPGHQDASREKYGRGRWLARIGCRKGLAPG